MKSIFLFLLIFLSSLIFTIEKDNETTSSTVVADQTRTEPKNKTIENITKPKENLENKTSTNSTEIKKPKPKKHKHNTPPPLKSSSQIPNDTSRVPNNEIYSLNDLTFDMVLRGGNYYKWLVILYSETCGHCEHARREIRKIFPEYKNSTSIRFAEIEINKNPLTNMRFEIEGVPYIFMLQNESMYELDLFPNQKNLKKFIETDFNEVEEELKPFPKMVPFYQVGLVVIGNIIRGITNVVNDLLYDFGYDFEFSPTLLVISFIGFICAICFLEFFCCARFCPDDEKPKKKKKKMKKKKEKTEEEKKKEEEEKKKEEEEKRKEEEKKKEEEEEEEDDEEEEEEEDDEDDNNKKIEEEEKKRNEEEKKRIEREKEKEKEEKKKEKKEKKKKRKEKKENKKNDEESDKIDKQEKEKEEKKEDGEKKNIKTKKKKE